MGDDSDFWQYVKQHKKERRDKRVNNAIKYLDKHGFKFTPSNTDNIVLLDYHTQQYRFSLNNFKICVNNDWITKRKSKLITSGTVLKFGKHIGKRLNEINDANYISWLLSKTDIMIGTDIFKQAN